MMAEAEETERPRAVTVIGRAWVILAVVLMLKALLNLVTVSIVRSTAPVLLQALGERLEMVPFVQWMLRNAGALFLAQALLWFLVGLCAWSFLRLRPWALVAIRIVCCLGIVYAAGFMVLWVELWKRGAFATKDPAPMGSHSTLPLVAVLVVWVLFGSLFGVMLGFLQSRRLREAFSNLHGQGSAR